MKHFDIIKKPLITEKGTNAQAASNQYYFAVDPRASKTEIKEAVSDIFKVTVTGVHTMRIRGKLRRVGRNVGRTAAWKKAIVTLKEGDRIEFLEGA
jgi:large subunit ribosomal protein L23